MMSAELVDLAIDLSTRELELDADGAPVQITGRRAAIQQCWVALRSARSEFFFDLNNLDDPPLEPNADVPDDEAWLGDWVFRPAIAEAQLRRTLLAVPGVVSVPSARAVVGEDRVARFEVTAIIGFDDDPAREELISG